MMGSQRVDQQSSFYEFGAFKSNNVRTETYIHVDGGGGFNYQDDFLKSEDAFNPSLYSDIDLVGLKYIAVLVNKDSADMLRYMGKYTQGGVNSTERGWYINYDIFGGKQCSTYAYALWNYVDNNGNPVTMPSNILVHPKSLSNILPFTL